MKWDHSRKGLIVGELVREDDTWMWVKLACDHRIPYASEMYRGRIDQEGEVLCLRKSFMTPVPPTIGEQARDLLDQAHAVLANPAKAQWHPKLRPLVARLESELAFWQQVGALMRQADDEQYSEL